MGLTISSCNKERQEDNFLKCGKVHHKLFEKMNEGFLHTNEILSQATNMEL